MSSAVSMKNIGRQARPSAKATGTRSNISAKKMPNRISAAVPGLEHAAAHAAASVLRLVTPDSTRSASAMCSPWNSSQVSPVSGQAMWIIHSGSSASSERRFQAKRVNC